jgi:hypothetical protein
LQLDKGHFLSTKDSTDLYKFRTPSLLNVGLTPPYGHAGSFATLEDVVGYHLSPEESLSKYDFSLSGLPQYAGSGYEYPNAFVNTKLALDSLISSVADGLDNHVHLGINQDQLSSVIEFLKVLSDECLKEVANEGSDCIAPWLPDEPSTDEQDPLQLKAQFSKFNNVPAAWRTFDEEAVPTPVNEIEGVSVVVESCSLTASSSGVEGDVSFVEVSGSVGLDYTVPLPNIVDLGLDDPFSLNDYAVLLSLENIGSAAAADINKDGYDDLIVYRGIAQGPSVFLGASDGQFTEATNDMGLSNDIGGVLHGIGLADLDGDDDFDLVLTGRKRSEDGGFLTAGFMDVYEMDQGSWLKVEQGDTVGRSAYSTSFADYDADGKLDIFVSSWAILLDSKEDFLWKNTGDLVFVGQGSSSSITGLLPSKDFSLTPISVDLNSNSWPDLVMVADFGKTQSIFNNGEGGYASDIFLGVPNFFIDENGMGAAAADYDNDGDLDVFVSSIYDEIVLPFGKKRTGNRLYQNDGSGRLVDVSEDAGIRDGGWGWGSCAADFNNDGHIDIFHTNGFGSLEVQRKFTFPGLYDAPMADKSRLFMSNGNGGFIESAVISGIDDDGQGRGVICFDYERDGDIDIFISPNSGSPKLYKNQLNHTEKRLVIELKDRKTANTQAIGAKLRLTNNGDAEVLPLLQFREVQANSNYLSQNPTKQFFGLGKSGIEHDLEITWPRPILEKTIIKGISPNQCVKITRPTN